MVPARGAGVNRAVEPDLLAAVVGAVRRAVEVRAAAEPLDAVRRRADRARPRPAAFRAALARPDRTNIIAECKRRSPLRGVLRARYDPVALARAYAAAGAAAISVLTEPTCFDGALEHLRAVREAVSVPVLCKDFILTEYQLLEARAAGADAVLLIVRALAPEELSSLIATARALELAPLVEVHDAQELHVALEVGADLIGINHRDLRTLTVDLTRSAALVAELPEDVVAVAESGVRSREQIEQLRAAGFDAFLVGEHLMTAPDPGAALLALIGGADAGPHGRDAG
jgi:indole-3-glycerol phosphate synthase